MTTSPPGRVAIVWRGDAAARASASGQRSRLVRVFEALAALDVDAEPAVFCEEEADAFRAQLFAADAALVWVDPITSGRNRAVLDAVLREAADRGLFVSAHPDVILRMGSKTVLYSTRHLGWGSDTRLYRDAHELRAGLTQSLAGGATRVLKQNRGNGGIGVWGVALAAPDAGIAGPGTALRVRSAVGSEAAEELTLAAFAERCAPYFAAGDVMVDQPFQARLAEGMVRCYLSHDTLVGFCHQYSQGLLEPHQRHAGPPPPKVMFDRDEPQYQRLRQQLEAAWIPGLMQQLALSATRLPVVWDADFLLGPRLPSGEDTYVLCEINVSAVLPIPDAAPAAIAQATVARMQAARAARSGRQ